MSKHDETRRDFVKKAAYAAPAILTLQAVSSVAKAGSGKEPERTLEEKSSKKVARNRRR